MRARAARALRRWLVAALVSVPMSAQQAPPVLTVQNLAPFARREWIAGVVPFARGAVAEVPDLHVEGCPTVWQPFGARWNDGSVRQAICLFRGTMGPLEEKQVPLVEGPGEAVADEPFGLGEHRVRFVATIDGRRSIGEATVDRMLEENAARKIAVLRGRIADTGLVIEATVEVLRGQDHAWYGFGVFFSDPTTTARMLRIEELAVETEGMALFLRHTGPLGVTSELTDVGSRHVLLRDTHLADGQGVRRAGVLVPPLTAGSDDETRLHNDTLQAATLCRPLAATRWSDSGAFGAFGYVPGPPPWIAGPAALRAALGQRHTGYVSWARKVSGDPLRSPRHGLAASAHQAGDQADFGVLAMEPVAGTGIPSFLFEVEWSVLQDGCRPSHYFEADGQPLIAANHPQWVAHNSRTHGHVSTSPDRLGKTDPKAPYDSHRWFGKDNQHWSNNYLCGYYLLTADPQTRLEIENEIQLYLGGRTLREGIWTSTAGVSRAAGRTMLAATWLYLCTGDEVLLERMRRRMHDVNYAQWERFRDAPLEQVRPFKIYGPDPRYFPEGDEAVWVPWEESLAVLGFAAYQELTGDRSEPMVAMIDGLALNLLSHGWRVREDGRAEVAYAVKILPGYRPPTEAERADRNFVSWPKSSFGVWALGSLEIGRAAAVRAGDERLAARADDLLRRVRARRPRPRDRFYDRFSQWDGVRLR